MQRALAAAALLALAAAAAAAATTAADADVLALLAAHGVEFRAADPPARPATYVHLIYLSIYLSIYVTMYVCMYVSIYVSMYVYLCVHWPTHVHACRGCLARTLPKASVSIFCLLACCSCPSLLLSLAYF